MKLNNPNTITFGGEPVTGRTPPSMIVAGGIGLTPEQSGGVKHAYKLFCDATRLSIAEYVVQNKALSDGTRVRMRSIQGVDTVFVIPPYDSQLQRLPHGFVVVNGASVALWGRPFNTATWSVKTRIVPQTKPSVMAYNITAHADFLSETTPSLVLPRVISGQAAMARIWDYSVRPATGISGVSAVPIVLRRGNAGIAIKESLYIEGIKIKNAKSGATEYEVLEIPPLSLSGDERIEHHPGNSTLSGKQATLSRYRTVIMVPSLYRRTHAYKTAVVSRDARGAWSSTETSAVFEAPIRGSVDGGPEVLSGIGIAADDYLFYKYVFFDNFSSFTAVWFFTYFQQYGWHIEPPDERTPATALFNWSETPVNLGWNWSENNASRELIDETAKTEIIANILRLPKIDEVSSISLTLALSYPRQQFWRTGTAQGGGYLDPPNGHGRAGGIIFRGDGEYSEVATPTASVDLKWGSGSAYTVHLINGTSSGIYSGLRYTDDEYYLTRMNRGTYSIASLAAQEEVYEGPAPPDDWMQLPTVPPPMTWDTAPFYAAYKTGNIKPDIDAWLALSGWQPQKLTTEAPDNTVDYTIESRTFIDYDHRGEFYAAIVVNVVCSGAVWHQSQNGFFGEMEKISDPTYIVSIKFESCWSGVVQSQTLSTETVVRQGFEFPLIRKSNPFLGIGGQAAEFDILIRVPPRFGFPEEAVSNFKTMTEHQGVNPRLAVCDAVYSPDGSLKEAVYSKTGVEYSYWTPTIKKGINKMPFGQLYSRRFKLSDFGGALWLLSEIKCEAQYNNLEIENGVSWYYFPVTKAALDVVRNIEVRDGVIGPWSGVIPATDDQQIKLYRV